MKSKYVTHYAEISGRGEKRVVETYSEWRVSWMRIHDNRHKGHRKGFIMRFSFTDIAKGKRLVLASLQTFLSCITY